MTTCKYCPHPGQPHRTDHERNWAIWRDYRTTSATLRDVGRAHGINAERVRHIVAKGDKAVIRGLTRTLDAPMPASDATREGTLGVEFVFTHGAALGGTEYYEGGWKPLAPRWRPVHTHNYALDEGIMYRVKND